MLDPTICFEAMQRRDPAFDGVFFVAVRTTKVYCRPVCTARMPLPKNVAFFPSAASAERAGFRPCLRCRPESAPFCPAWKGTKTTVERALHLIETGALDNGTVDTLASRLGVGSRHLSRLFAKHLDASPLQVAKTLRIQRARRLLEENKLSIAEIAWRAGFTSTRRMNAAFSDVYGQPPSAMKVARGPRTGGGLRRPSTSPPQTGERRGTVST
jgi:AraC family transcriptional regulator of adaptative response/methylated-DNA-[protein]-cysteine methyltransferase